MNTDRNETVSIGKRILMMLMCAVLFLTSSPLDVLEVFDNTTASAEGSATMSSQNSGYRTYLEYFISEGNPPAVASTAGVPRRQLIYVYVKKGEVVYFGSSVKDSQLSEVSLDSIGVETRNTSTACDIYVESPSGKAVSEDTKTKGFDVTDSVGFINTRAKELAGPKIVGYNDSEDLLAYNADCYEPLSFVAEETGVYTFHFHSKTGKRASPNGTGNVNTLDFISGQNAKGDSSNGGDVGAWDITVYNSEDKIVKNGRTFATYLAWTTGINPGGEVMDAGVYVVTNDGYIYNTDFNGLDPNGFVFFANNRGIIDTETNSPAYRSYVSSNNNVTGLEQSGAAIHNPMLSDTDLDQTYKIFFDQPDPELVGDFLPEAYEPTPARNFRFLGTRGEGGTFIGVGGYFTFDVENATSATITLDMRDISYFDYSANQMVEHKNFGVVTLSDVVTPGQQNSFFWDGYGYEMESDDINAGYKLDSSGNRIRKIVPVGSYDNNSIKVSLDTHSGEYHLPLIDAETNVKGIKVQRMNDIKAVRDVKITADGTIWCSNGVKITVSEENGRKVYYHTAYGNDGIEIFNNLELPVQQMTLDVTCEYEDSKYDVYYNNKDVIRGPSVAASKTIADSKDYSQNPVSSQNGAMIYGNSKGDQALLDMWTFAVGERVEVMLSNPINIVEELSTIVTGRVFFDTNKNGSFSITENDYTLSGIEVEIKYHPYKLRPALDELGNEILDDDGNVVWEDDFDPVTHEALIDYSKWETAVTTTDAAGNYYFYDIPYNNKLEGFYDPEVDNFCTITVKRPNSVYTLTTQNKISGDFVNYPQDKLVLKNESGNYVDIQGNEVSAAEQVKVSLAGVDEGAGQQSFVIGTYGICPDNESYVKKKGMITVSDVGWYAAATDQQMTIKKDWRLDKEFDSYRPTTIELTVSGICDAKGNSAIEKTVILDEYGSWMTHLSNLPKFDSEGHELKYKVTDERFTYRGHNYRFDGTYYYKDGTNLGTADADGNSPDGYPYKTAIVNCDTLIFGEFSTTVINAPKTSTLQITKLDSEDNKKKVVGAKFKLFRVKLDTDGNPVLDDDGKEVLVEVEASEASVTTDENGLFLFKGDNVSSGEYIIETEAPSGYVQDNNRRIKVFVNVHDPESAGEIDEADKASYVFPENQLITVYNRPVRNVLRLEKKISSSFTADKTFNFNIEYADDEAFTVNKNTVSASVKVPKNSAETSFEVIFDAPDGLGGTKKTANLELPNDVYLRVNETADTDYDYLASASELHYTALTVGAESEVLKDSYALNSVFQLENSGIYTLYMFNKLKYAPDISFVKVWLDENGSRVTDFTGLPDVSGKLQYSTDLSAWNDVALSDVGGSKSSFASSQTILKSSSYERKYAKSTWKLSAADSDGKKYTYRYKENPADNYLEFKGSVTYSGSNATFTNPVTGKSETLTGKTKSDFQNNLYVINYEYISKDVIPAEEREALVGSAADEKAFAEKLRKKSVDGGRVTAGDSVTYMVKLNSRALTANSTTVITDAVPEGCSYVEGTGKIYAEKYSGGKYTLTPQSNAVTLSGGKLTSTVKIASSTNYYLLFDVTVDEASESIENTAYAAYDGRTFTSNTVSIAAENGIGYIRIEQRIPVSDPSQSFLFKIEKLDEEGNVSETYYTDIRCTEMQNTGGLKEYVGTAILCVKADSEYRVTAVTDWAATDYDINSNRTEYRGKENTGVADKAKNTVTIKLPDAYPSDSEEYGIPTAAFACLPSVYAFRTDSAFAENRLALKE